jgi:hypothetical protein
MLPRVEAYVGCAGAGGGARVVSGMLMWGRADGRRQSAHAAGSVVLLNQKQAPSERSKRTPLRLDAGQRQRSTRDQSAASCPEGWRIA